MIHRVEEIERRLQSIAGTFKALSDRLQAVDDRSMQIAGALGNAMSSSTNVTFGRASGAISARSGTTLGTGTFNFASATTGALVEGNRPETCKNLINKAIDDDAWLLLVKEPDWWVVVAVGAPCDDLS